MSFNEVHNICEPESSLTTLGTVVLKPSTIGVASNGRWANAKQSTHFLQSQLWIEKSFDQILASLPELACVVVRGDIVIKKCAQKLDILWKPGPNIVKLRVQSWSPIGHVADLTWTWRAELGSLRAFALRSSMRLRLFSRRNSILSRGRAVQELTNTWQIKIELVSGLILLICGKRLLYVCNRIKLFLRCHTRLPSTNHLSYYSPFGDALDTVWAK